MKRLKNYLYFLYKTIYYIINYIPALIVYKLFYFSEKKKGLITIGSSNGKFYSNNSAELFKFLNQKEENIYYIIDKNSLDKKKAKKDGEILWRFSFKANLKVLRSEILIYDTSYKDLIRCDKKYLENSIKINIFHGIHALKKISKSNAKNRLKNDNYIISTSNYEKNIKINWGFKNKQIWITGLPRFDSLFENKSKYIKNQIFYMPTWRPWLKKGFIAPDLNDIKKFKESNYFKRILQLANSNKINRLLINSDLTLKIYVHKLMYRYLKNVKLNLKMSNIEFLSQNINVQEQILKSKLLITDYSSVIFDFLYLQKPIILYQFDYDEFYNSIPGSYVSKEDILKLRVENIHELEILIKNKVKKNFKLNKTERKLQEKFIYHIDNNNCKRIYENLNKISTIGDD